MTYDGTVPQIDDAELPSYGENVARTLIASGHIRGTSISKDIVANIKELRERHTVLESKYSSGDAIPSFIEWFLDNFYLAHREGLQAASELHRCGRIPASKGTASLFMLCAALLRSGNGKVTPERCQLFLEGCQNVYVLSRRELMYFIPVLKAAAVSELALLYGSDIDDEDKAALSAERLFSTLRILSTLDFSDIIESVDKTEQILKCDPADIYQHMSDKTRRHYKKRVEKLAKAYHVSEHRIAEHVLGLSQKSDCDARHVGYWLFTCPMGEEKKSRSGDVYISANIIITLLLTLLIGFAVKSVVAAVLVLIPISELVKNLIDLILLNSTRPAHVPRMELKEGIPNEGRTICVISALLTSEKSGAVLARRIEEYRLANRNCGDNLLFGILGDLPDGENKFMPNDENYINSVKTAIDELNKKYGGGFFFFVRDRVYSKEDKRYMAWERKRGAITELASLLYDGKSSLLCLSGNKLSLRGVRYILTLDEDTRLTPGTAKELIGAMLHPLNAPVIDNTSRKVVSGHAIIHPRISVELSSCNKSHFSKIFAGHGGTDPYGSDSSELYMDLFDNGGFAGKGIIDAKVFTECMRDRLPENRILSHDAIEGAYLRGGYMGDSELTDKFPYDILSYYKRLHRWTRGDWQNIPWLSRRGRNLTEIDRFRLFDSVRRSVVAPLTFISFITAFLFPTTEFTTVALFALASYAFHFIVTTIQNLFRDEREVRIHFHSTIIRGISGSLLQTALKLAFIPFEAYICFTAAITALWRMGISHKGFLNWTPASVFDGKSNGVMRYVCSMWFSLLTGIALIIFSVSIIGKVSGVIWFFFPLMASSLSKTIVKQIPVSNADRSYLLQHAKQIWSFFEDFCTAEEHFLPPDNWQDRPPIGIAHRTSPTNIGLCLLSCLSAIDLNLTNHQTALGLIENILITLKRMQKWNGHLYNWYDTRTLKPLHPTYVSTVDSGNLAACLIILREGLLEFDRPDLAAYCNELLLPMSFEPLYDESHHLFSIGIDTDKEIVTNSFYDLMASEARTAGFIAIARGEVPRRHWRSLSRAQVEKDGYRGMVSWTGSMFEYLMPRLFFESTECSLMYESMKFAVGVQKKQGKIRKLPWGISESAFYALDPALNYRYKAHGCGALALKRNMNSEFVISPYSTFLALCCGVKQAVSNLRKIERYNAIGKYGFWEAIDFTEGRVAGNNGEVVYCVMAHHLGMSLVAINNALCGNIMPHRLMRDPCMSAHACLLDEKLPLAGVLLHRKENKSPEKPPRANSVFWEKHDNFVDFESPQCGLLSNGEYNIMLTDSGVAHTLCGDIAPYYTPKSIPAFDHGLELYLKCDNELVSLLPSADSSNNVKFEWEFNFSGAKFSTEQANLKSQVLCSVSATSNGEKRVISARTVNGNTLNSELIVMFKPILAPINDYVNHPAFLNLGLHAKTLGNSLIVKRLKRDKIRECYLCFACSSQMEVSAKKELIPGRGGLLSALENFSSSSLGWLINPLVCAKIPMRVTDSDSVITIAIAIGNSEHEAYTNANRILASDIGDTANFPAEFAAGLRMTDAQANDAMKLLNAISYPALQKTDKVVAKHELWRFGISGDLPIVTHKISSDEDLETAESLMKQHSFLKSLSQNFDLAFITDEGGNYLRPKATSLSELKRTAGNDSLNIHIIDISTDADSLINNSVLPRERDNSKEYSRYALSKINNAPQQSFPEFEWLEDSSFRFYINHSLPPRAWSNILTNGRYGYIATDCGTGHMWFKNARECRINRWICDAISVKGTESVEISGKSVFATPEDTNCVVSFGFGYAEWKKVENNLKTITTAFIPNDTDARILIVEWDSSEELEIRWNTDLILSGDDSNAPRARVEFSNNMFTAESPESPFPNSPFKVASSAHITGYTTNRILWLKGKTDDSCGTGGFLGVSFKSKSPFILVCGCDEDDKLKELCNDAAALASLKNTNKNWTNAISGLKIKTPIPSLDHLINGWLPYQTLACRLMGRCSIYQSGGATGFRDQLQDAVNIILIEPAFAKAQILESCRHQYEEGDVMHWWHTLDGVTKGVRTHCSDDLLWLPWAICEYTEKTGDYSVCNIPVAWLTSHPLHIDEHDRYEQAIYTENLSEVIEHAKKALDLVIGRGTGDHGLLKIGNGDWNDGMDKIGIRGRGESVWLTWFFILTAKRFANLLRLLGNSKDADKYELILAELEKYANDAWDGEWYLRGYFDDGTPLGSKSNLNCKIDSIAQSFASLSNGADKERANKALSSAVANLFDRQHNFIRLFEPPFENSKPYPGYIESYGPGFRENGGQYTHGAIWLVMALLRENRPDEAAELISALLPDNRDLLNYEAEPYVISADIASNPDCAGKAGWSWYTGSSGWFYRVITEDLLGIKMQNGEIVFSPNLPSIWNECEVVLKDKDGKEKTIVLKGKLTNNKENVTDL